MGCPLIHGFSIYDDYWKPKIVLIVKVNYVEFLTPRKAQVTVFGKIYWKFVFI